LNYDFIKSDELLLSIDVIGQFLFLFFVAQTADIVASAKAVGGKIIGG